jgi:flagellar biosynthesis/type III secretory pathway chaperone
LLEETNHKIQGILQTINLSGDLLSSPEIEAYERYINNLTSKLIQENITAVFALLKAIEDDLRCKKKIGKSENYGFLTKTEIKKLCRDLRSELLVNKDLLSTCQDYWGSLYRLMKFEDYFQKVSVM